MDALCPLTLIPSNRDKALSGRRARRVLRDLMGPISEYPRVLATRLIKETWMETQRKRKFSLLEHSSHFPSPLTFLPRKKQLVSGTVEGGKS